MTGAEFILFVKAKLNRLDTSAYEDVRPEEILFFGRDALKLLTLEFDLGIYSQKLDRATVNNYLSYISKRVELDMVNSASAIFDLLKIKDATGYIEVGDEKGWRPLKEKILDGVYNREDNTFRKSTPVEPTYILEQGSIKVLTNGFVCTKVELVYLVNPLEIEEYTILNFPFTQELQDKTVSLILENLENRRLSTQPVVSK